MTRPQLKGGVAATVERVRKDNNYGSTNETIREVLREAGYEVRE